MRSSRTEKLIHMMYRLVMFDSDGTLADTLPWMRSVFNELAAEHGFRQLAPDEQERYRDLHGQELFRALNLPVWKVPQVVAGMRRRMADYPGDLRVFPGIDDALATLRDAGMQLAVVSSNSLANVQRVLGPENSKRIAHFACGVSMFGKAAKLRSVLRAAGMRGPEAIYVGDEIRDGEAARKAGVHFGAVGWGQHSASALRSLKPEQFFEFVAELKRLAR
jgi:phosphoglycolate phosphatase